MLRTLGWANHGDDADNTMGDMHVVIWSGPDTLDGLIVGDRFAIHVHRAERPNAPFANAAMSFDRRDAIYLRNALTAYIELGIGKDSKD